MHELGLMEAVLRMTDDIIAEENVTEVSRIVLEVGELSGAVPHFLEDCFEAAVYKTRYENTALEIETVPGTARCNDCDIEFVVNPEALQCPQCGGINLTPLTGRDLTIKEIVVV